MQATYRPALRIPREWLTTPAAARKSAAEATLPLPSMDEDEVTLAVAAAEAVLQRAEIAPGQVRRIALSSRTGSSLGPLFASALGVAPERVEEGTAILYGQTSFPSPGEGPVLHIQVEAPRPGRFVGESPRAGAFATARLSGPGVPPGPDFEVPVRPWTPTADAVEKLARWENEAPWRLPMAAYIPAGTWAASTRSRYRLEGSRCSQGHVAFPPRDRCARCHAPASPHALPRTGSLETFTVIAKGSAPSEFEPLQDVVGDYAVGIASFGGARMAGLLTETPFDALRIGAKVEVVFRRLYAQDGAWRYGLKLRIAVPAQATSPGSSPAA